MKTAELQEILRRYLDIFPAEEAALQPLLAQVGEGEALNNRKNFRGHVTAGALVLSQDRTKILAVYHKLFKKWLQPGGHWDEGEASPWAAAKREAEEETSVAIARHIAVFDDPRVPLDIGSHTIMPRPDKNEPPHTHYDLRYVFIAKNERLRPRESEVLACEWLPLDDPRLLHLAAIIQKLRQFSGLLT